jgi:hypothetical protein
VNNGKSPEPNVPLNEADSRLRSDRKNASKSRPRTNGYTASSRNVRRLAGSLNVSKFHALRQLLPQLFVPNAPRRTNAVIASN